MSIDGLGQVADFNPSPATASQQLVTSQARVLYGWSIAEASGSAFAKVRLRDGTSAAGKLLGVIALIPNESTRDFFPVEAIVINTGAIYLEVVTGRVEGCVYY